MKCNHDIICEYLLIYYPRLNVTFPNIKCTNVFSLGYNELALSYVYLVRLAISMESVGATLSWLAS